MSKLGGLHKDFKIFTDIVFWFSLSWSYHIEKEKINQKDNNSLIRLTKRDIYKMSKLGGLNIDFKIFTDIVFLVFVVLELSHWNRNKYQRGDN